ncbi:MAG: flagellar motor protein MotB, partial [Campylobacterota bacterium]
MARKKKCECPKGIPLWIVTFGDLMSLLLTFFILLLSMSSLDAKKVDAAFGSLAGATSILDGGVKTEINKEIAQQAATSDAGAQMAQEAASVVSDFNEMIESQGGVSMTVEEAQEGFTIQLPSSILFEEGEARITNEDAILFLRRLALMFENMPPDLELNIRGHTDNIAPPATS